MSNITTQAPEAETATERYYLNTATGRPLRVKANGHHCVTLTRFGEVIPTVFTSYERRFLIPLQIKNICKKDLLKLRSI